jgi:hypothetical protein
MRAFLRRSLVSTFNFCGVAILLCIYDFVSDLLSFGLRYGKVGPRVMSHSLVGTRLFIGVDTCSCRFTGISSDMF